MNLAFRGSGCRQAVWKRQGHCWHRALEILGPKMRNRLPPTHTTCTSRPVCVCSCDLTRSLSQSLGHSLRHSPTLQKLGRDNVMPPGPEAGTHWTSGPELSCLEIQAEVVASHPPLSRPTTAFVK